MDSQSLLIPLSPSLHMLDIHGLRSKYKSVCIDLGCGKGRFLLAYASRNPNKLAIGVDRLLHRLIRIEAKAQSAGLRNVRLVHANASLFVSCLLPDSSVDTIFIFFPDPWPKRRHHKRRFFSPHVVDSIHRVLKPGGEIHVATDHADYAEAIQKLFSNDIRFQARQVYQPSPEEQTDFEIIFLQKGTRIYRFSFSRRPETATEFSAGAKDLSDDNPMSIA